MMILIMKNKRTVIRGALLLVLLSAGACSSSTESPAAPSAPTLAAPAAPSSPGTATISGTLASASGARMTVHTTAVGLTVSVSGTGISATVAPGGTFLLNGVPAGDVTLQFTGPGVNARATISGVQDREEIRIVVNVSGSQATVNITDRHKPPSGAELEGLIASTNTSAQTLVVNGMTVSVPSSAVIRHGNKTFTFTDLKVGQRVHVKGTQNGSAIVASEIKVQDEKPPETEEAEVEGTVSALSGSCPSLTFMVGTTKVTTSASTQFKATLCSQVTNGVKAEVKGIGQADGSIAATRVAVDREDD